MNLKVYAIFEGNKIIKMSHNLEEMINYILSFPIQERKLFTLCEKTIYQGLVSYKPIKIRKEVKIWEYGVDMMMLENLSEF